MTISIKTHNYFPVHYMVLGAGFAIYGIITFLSNPLVSIPLIIIGIMFLSTHYRFILDMEEKRYRDYFWILGLKKGDWATFQHTDFFYINTSKYTQSYGPVSVRFDSNFHKFVCYLKLDDEININLGESVFKRKIVKKINKLNQHLNIPVRDLTEVD